MTNRRNFIKNSVLSSTGILFINSFLGCINNRLKVENIDKLYNGFQNPPGESKLFVRWWWNGNRLAKKEILRELDVMKAAGIGGVEINPIAFPRNTDSEGYEAMTMFDDNWLDMLQVALQGAKDRGIICDMIVGSGWPFGGEFLKKEEQTQIVTVETIDLSGKNKYCFNISKLLEKVSPAIHSKNKNVYTDLVMVRLLPKESKDFLSGLDLKSDINNDILEVDVPEGNHVLYCVVKLTGYMAVINGAPGAAGPVLNHYNKEATENYLNRISGFISEKIGDMGNYIRAMFCDSMELEGANWNDDLPLEFEKRRGYSLLPYLPFILKKIKKGNPLDEEYGTKFSKSVVERLKRIELDLYQTRIELFKERFIDTFNKWCHKNNVKSRMQAYGRGMHPLEASMEIDIPECETWLFKDAGREYPNTGKKGRAPLMCNKYVSSAAALTGKNIVSCEEMTNTNMVFMATLENIKIAGDQSNISGVNHSILHGFNYSPPEAKFPGWVRFGTYFNEQNTWWPYFKKWSAYKARISYILQNASPQANIAILQPLTDLWLKYGPQRNPFPRQCYPQYQNNLWEAINQNGGGCDYVSENIINKASFQNGNMIYNERSYSTLLLPEIETLDLETANSLLAFANAGGRIIFIGKKPFKSSASKNSGESDKKVEKIIADLSDKNKENVIVYPSPKENLIEWYGKLQDKQCLKPYVKFDRTHKYLSQASYIIGENRVFFIVNSSLSEHISVKANFQVEENMYPWIWNPETGNKMRYPTNGSNNIINLEIPRATSFLIVFEKQSDGELFPTINFSKRKKEITGLWHLELHHMNGEKNYIETENLASLTSMDNMRNFAGEVIYTKTFNSNSCQYKYIDLGDVQGVTELTLNNESLGVRWYGAHIYNIKKALKKGENRLTIKLTTITGNYLKSLKDNAVAQKWTKNQDYYPVGIIGPVSIFL